MADESSESARLAVLIGADNARPSVVGGLLAEVAKYGVAGVRRIYGDWTTPNLAGWKAVLLDHSIQPVQQFRYTVGKNATDSAMIIDAMDLLHSRRLDGFCIVSSDSDFTGLARRIREDGLLVVGFGERKTPRPFVAACDRFVYTELLGPETPARAPFAASCCARPRGAGAAWRCWTPTRPRSSSGRRPASPWDTAMRRRSRRSPSSARSTPSAVGGVRWPAWAA